MSRGGYGCCVSIKRPVSQWGDGYRVSKKACVPRCGGVQYGCCVNQKALVPWAVRVSCQSEGISCGGYGCPVNWGGVCPMIREGESGVRVHWKACVPWEGTGVPSIGAACVPSWEGGDGGRTGGLVVRIFCTKRLRRMKNTNCSLALPAAVLDVGPFINLLFMFASTRRCTRQSGHYSISNGGGWVQYVVLGSNCPHPRRLIEKKNRTS